MAIGLGLASVPDLLCVIPCTASSVQLHLFFPGETDLWVKVMQL